MATSKEQPHVAILASQAQPKIDGVILGVQKENPLTSGQRRFLVVRDLKEGGIEIQQREEQIVEGKPVLSDNTTLYQGVFSARRIAEIISSDTFSHIAPDVVLFAKDSQSFVRNQPIRAQKRWRYNRDEGYKGAKNRVQYIKDHYLDTAYTYQISDMDNQEKFSYHVGEVIGIENAQVENDNPEAVKSEKNTIQEIVAGIRGMVSRRAKDVTYMDVGFVVIENDKGQIEQTQSIGVPFGHDGGKGYFSASEKTGFAIPAGHVYAEQLEDQGIVVDKQNPHSVATGGLYSRAELLVAPVAIGLRRLRMRI